MGNLRPDGTKQAAATESDSVTGGERESLNNNSFSQPNAEPGVDRLAPVPVNPSDPASSSATKTTRIRFLDQLSPDAQKAYHDEQERRREEKKSKIEQVGESQ